MSDSRKIVRVFLGSPGDLGPERQAAREEVDEFNRLWADHFGHQIHLVRWEDVVSASGRPQSIINDDLDRCELFIGMLFQRWGMPPDNGGPYTSGFEEEFRTSLERQKRTSKPEIKMLFKAVDAARLADPGQELSKVIAFKDELIRTREVLFEQFGDIPEFRKKFTACITRHIQTLLTEGADRAQEVLEADQEVSKPTPTGSADAQGPASALSIEEASFVRGLLDVSASDGELPATDVARLRLIGAAFGSSANDKTWVGAHDANLIFTNREDLDLSGRETQALIGSGLANYNSENVPLWYWLKKTSGFASTSFAYRSYFGHAQTRAGAISVMTALGIGLPEDEFLTRSALIEQWLSDNSTAAVKDAALKYLTKWGKTSDLELVRSELEKNNYSTRGSAAQAIVSIIARDSRSDALKELFKIKPDQFDESITEKLLEEPEAYELDVLKAGISQQSVTIRRAVVHALIKRDALDLVSAQELFADADEIVRVAAVRRARALGHLVSGKEVADILRPKPKNLFANALASTPAKSDFEDILRIEEMLLGGRGKDDSHEIVDFLDVAPYLAWVERNYKKEKDRVLSDIGDHYKRAFATYITNLKKLHDGQAFVDRLVDMEEFLRQKVLKAAISIASRKGGSETLSTVRKIVGEREVEYCEEPVNFLRLHGEFGDIASISKWSGRKSPGLGLLAFGGDRRAKVAAESIYELGKNRLDELLSRDDIKEYLRDIVKLSADSKFRSISDRVLDNLLRVEDHQVRKIVCLKIVKCLPKSRASEILHRHETSESTYYYNVRFWLDLGLSAPSSTARATATRLID